MKGQFQDYKSWKDKLLVTCLKFRTAKKCNIFSNLSLLNSLFTYSQVNLYFKAYNLCVIIFCQSPAIT